MIRLMIILMILLVLGLGAHRVSAQQDDAAASDVINAINDWRISQGLWPLRLNTTLQAMAVAQAEYILSLPDIPDGGDIHLGKQGEGPKERALWLPYNWPIYGRPDRIDVDEIAYVGRNASAAISFWQGSTVHRTTALNPSYREIGVASLPHRFGHLYIVVVGARPNVLPAVVNRGEIYLSNEHFYAPSGDQWIYKATQIRLFDADGKPLSGGWIPWQAVIPVPPNAGNRLFIEYSDQKVQVMTEVSLENAVPEAVIIPPTLTGPKPTPISEPDSTQAPAETAPLVQVVPTPTELPAVQSTTSVLIIYDSHALTVLHNSSGPADLSGLIFVQGNLVLPASLWENPWLNAPLNAFPAHDCLRAWAWNEPAEPPAPPACRYQRSVFYVDPEQRFWSSGQFEVHWQSTLLATCNAQDGQCIAALP
jgi:hypothetical protein